MSTILTINAVDKTNLIMWESIQREQVLTKEPDKFRFSLKKHAGQTYKPQSGDEVIFTIDGEKQFGGYVTEIRESAMGLGESIQILCKDYTHGLDRNLVSKTYIGETVNDIIADLVDTFAVGFTVTNVDCEEVIDRVAFNYLPISRCLEKITELLGGYEWYVDYEKDIHFYLQTAQTPSHHFTDTSGNYFYPTLEIREDTHQMRNEIIVRGGLLTSETPRTDYLTGDGTIDTFPLATKFASLPTVLIGAVAQTVGVENIDGVGFDCYWNYNEKSLTFVTPPVVGTSNISVTQVYEYPLILQKRNESSVATYGIFQFVIIDKTIRDLETAGLRADSELLKYSLPINSADFETDSIDFRAGQTINIQSDIRGVNKDFKVQVIRSRMKDGVNGEFRHSVEALTADDIGINDILARLLIKNPSDQIQIAEDEVISRIRAFSESIGFSMTETISVDSIIDFVYRYDDSGGSLWNFSVYGN